MKTKSKKNLIIILIVLSFLILLFAFGTVMLVLDANHVFSKAASKKPVKIQTIKEDDGTNKDSENAIAMDAFSVVREGEELTITNFSDIPQEVRMRDYMIKDSNTRLLTLEDLTGLGKSELIIARNELYARYGLIFQDAELTAYFTAKIWYVPTIPADQFTEEQFNEFEKANVIFITNYEKEKGYN